MNGHAKTRQFAVFQHTTVVTFSKWYCRKFGPTGHSMPSYMIGQVPKVAVDTFCVGYVSSYGRVWFLHYTPLVACLLGKCCVMQQTM